MENKLIVPGQSRIFASVLGAVIVVCAALTVIAGLPPADQMTNFALGLIVLVAVTAGIGALLGWYLLVRPLPDRGSARAQAAARSRCAASQIVALILTLGTLSIGIAGVWDEIWHVEIWHPFRPGLSLAAAFVAVFWSLRTGACRPLELVGADDEQQRDAAAAFPCA